MSLTLQGHCSKCGIEREFDSQEWEYPTDGRLLISGTCPVCQGIIVKDMGDAVHIMSKCPVCTAEVTIMTFDGDPTGSPQSCGVCGFAGELQVTRTIRGNKDTT